ncbi:MAG: TraB/GumN family protein [Sphingomicrobium sp.]
MLQAILRRALAALTVSLTLVAAPTMARPTQVARPALWKVSDPDTTIYLFGTIHLLPPKYQWRSAKLDKAMTDSQQLIVETLVDTQKFMAAMASLAFNTPNLPPLAERVPPAKRAALADLMRKAGVAPHAFDRMETWAPAIILLNERFKEIGLQSDQGVEVVLRSTFASKSKPLGELETTAEQLGFFDALPEKAQRQLLEGAVDDPENMRKDFQGMLAAWVRGDVPAVARTFNHDLSDSPALQQALIKRRNANWAKWIENRMTQPGEIMIAVGAGHLAGKDSVIALLQHDGYRVRRVQ